MELYNFIALSVLNNNRFSFPLRLLFLPLPTFVFPVKKHEKRDDEMLL